MNENNKIAFLGGDKRQSITAEKMSERGWDCCIWGQESGKREVVRHSDSLEEAVRGARAVVLPLPASLDGVTLNYAPSESEGRARLESGIKALPDGALLIGGKLPTAFVESAKKRNITCFDYFESEAFQIENAYITAEAAVAIAMNNIGKTVRDSKSFHQTVWGEHLGKICQGIKFGCIGVKRLLGQPFQQMLLEYNDPFLDPYIRNLSLVKQLVCACMRQTNCLG